MSVCNVDSCVLLDYYSVFIKLVCLITNIGYVLMSSMLIIDIAFVWYIQDLYYGISNRLVLALEIANRQPSIFEFSVSCHLLLHRRSVMSIYYNEKSFKVWVCIVILFWYLPHFLWSFYSFLHMYYVFWLYILLWLVVCLFKWFMITRNCSSASLVNLDPLLTTSPFVRLVPSNILLWWLCQGHELVIHVLYHLHTLILSDSVSESFASRVYEKFLLGVVRNSLYLLIILINNCFFTWLLTELVFSGKVFAGNFTSNRQVF